MVIQQCDCAFAAVHIEKPPTYLGPFCFHDYCNKTLLEYQTQCIKKFYTELDLELNCLDCKQPQCVSWDYQSQFSALKYFINFPAYDFVDDFLNINHPAIEDMINVYGNITNVPDTFISNNFAKVTVTFADLHIRHKKAYKTMSGFSLFSDLGGAFGFWIGCSVLTFLEIFEWIIRMFTSTTVENIAPTKSETELQHQ